jgi:hypothetical protein
MKGNKSFYQGGNLLMETSTESLADKYIEFLGIFPQLAYSHELPTWDDFFDYVGIKTEDRSDFLAAAILKQVGEKQ